MLEISEIPCPLAKGADERTCLSVCIREATRLLGCSRDDIELIELRRKSIDARKKSDVHFTLSARLRLVGDIAETDLLERVPQRDRRRIRTVDQADPTFQRVREDPPRGTRPVVVGAGCAGLFAALALAEAGMRPLLLERGDDAARRSSAVGRFNETGSLDTQSNIQFGLGGAGTFSDGKLNTGTKNPLHRLVLRTLVDAGAPRDILWDAKPHIGSDILPDVVTNLVARIERLGGEVRFRTTVIDFETAADGALSSLTLHGTDGTEVIRAERAILACGHSARDVFELLNLHGVRLQRKTFAMGVRIEHLQDDIDRSLYGRAAGHPALGAAPYSLVAHLDGGRSVFSFCMCPGGEVVAAASEDDGVVTNGASLHARAGRNANAALLVNVTPEDLPGDDPLEGMRLQRACERAAFTAGGGDYRAPAQLVGDFLAHRPSIGPGKVLPTYPRGVTWGEIDGTLPRHVIEALREGIPLLGRKIRGYDAADAVLTAVESRSSSPITVVRDRTTLMSVSTPGLYPCGEGAGYAGGIMSAATDGIRCAQALIEGA